MRSSTSVCRVEGSSCEVWHLSCDIGQVILICLADDVVMLFEYVVCNFWFRLFRVAKGDIFGLEIFGS